MTTQGESQSKWKQFSDSPLGQNIWSFDAVGSAVALAATVSIGMWQPALGRVVTPLYAELALGGAVLAVSLTSSQFSQLSHPMIT
jgi:hypothetical protein